MTFLAKAVERLKEHSNLIENFFSLSTLNLINKVFPLLIFPYLVRTLGIEKFGLISFAMAFFMYFNVVVEYGFNLVGTKEISVNKNNQSILNKIYFSIIGAKIILLIIVVILAYVVISIVPRLNEDKVFFLSFIPILCGNLFLLTWLFQGVEKMRFITIVNGIGKSLSAILILVFIRESENYILYPLILSIESLIIGFLSVFFSVKYCGISFVKISFSDVVYYLKLGWYLFLSRVFVNLSSSSNIFILGIFTTEILVGYYSVASKIVTSILSVIEVLNQTLYPRMAVLYEDTYTLYRKYFDKLFLTLLIVCVCLTISVLFFSELLIMLVAGDVALDSVNILRILAFILLFAPIGSFFTKQFVIHGELKTVFYVLAITMLINMLIVIPAISYANIYGLAVGSVIVQLLHVLLNVRFMKKINLTTHNKQPLL